MKETYCVVYAPFEYNGLYELEIDSIDEETVWEWYEDSDKGNSEEYTRFDTLDEAEEYFEKNCQYPRTWYSKSQHKVTGHLYYIVKEIWCDDPDDGIDYEDVLKYSAAKMTKNE